jgi:hypothetical protein
MIKKDILKLLHDKHEDFFNLLDVMPLDVFNAHVENKWSPHQNLDHIRRSVRPLALGYRLPKFLIRLIAGKSNRPSRTYDALVTRYTEKLTPGVGARGRFVPGVSNLQGKEEMIQKIKSYVRAIIQAVENNWSEEELEIYVFPHPLLGKLTAREMLYFTAYHVQHHKEIVKKYYCS